MGLCNLKISEDSAYGTCDSENGDLDSPTANVPVEVIPHLFLGNAKNSADMNVLKNCGITYILNVTPNVPNKFEEDSTFKYMKIPISDHLSQNLSRFFPQAIAFIGEYIQLFVPVLCYFRYQIQYDGVLSNWVIYRTSGRGKLYLKNPLWNWTSFP